MYPVGVTTLNPASGSIFMSLVFVSCGTFIMLFPFISKLALVTVTGSALIKFIEESLTISIEGRAEGPPNAI